MQFELVLVQSKRDGSDLILWQVDFLFDWNIFLIGCISLSDFFFGNLVQKVVIYSFLCLSMDLLLIYNLYVYSLDQ